MDKPLTYPVLPLRDIVVFPHMIIPLFVGREKSASAINAATRADKTILLAAQKIAVTESPLADDLYTVGTIGIIEQQMKLPGGQIKLLVRGTRRARIIRLTGNAAYLEAAVEFLDDSVGDESNLEKMRHAALAHFREALQHQNDPASRKAQTDEETNAKVRALQQLLETKPMTHAERLERAFKLMGISQKKEPE